MHRVPIRLKLAAAMSVPLLALVLTTTFDLVDQSAEVDALSNQAELARAAVGPGGLIDQLQDERTWAVVDLAGADALGIHAPVESYDESRRLTDMAVTALIDEVEAGDDAVAAIFAPAIDGLAAIDRLRADIDANLASSPAAGTTGNTDFTEQIYARYVGLVRPFFDATDEVIRSISDTRLRRGAELVNLVSRDIQQYSELSRRMLIDGTSANGVDERDEIRRASASRALWDAYNARLAAAKAPFDRVVAEHFPTGFVADVTELSDRTLSGEILSTDELVGPMTVANGGGLKELRQALSDEVNRTADRIVSDARRRERIALLTAGATLVAALVLTWLVSRSITGPLRSLTQQARRMARGRLPAAVLAVLDTPLGEDVRVAELDPVRVATRDEVADVADVLNTVQDTALGLAVEQALLRRNIADSFVNLGRRNQTLLVRQLDFITRLESTETDPDVLANLYRLDHLATCMRRNAESLLVLAGVEPPRQWSTPVRLADVVRAALGEVEDYQRVAVRDLAPATILGSAAADLAHLLAELIENALTYSPTERPVEVKGRFLAGGAYSVAVTDTGVGMDPRALAVANRRLAGAESFAVAPSTYLGHYVAGNLAARHGIEVRLVPTPGRPGITAIIGLPPELLTGDDQVLVPSGAPGSRAAGQQTRR